MFEIRIEEMRARLEELRSQKAEIHVEMEQIKQKLLKIAVEEKMWPLIELKRYPRTHR